jgi:hypothetical protein
LTGRYVHINISKVARERQRDLFLRRSTVEISLKLAEAVELEKIRASAKEAAQKPMVL